MSKSESTSIAAAYHEGCQLPNRLFHFKMMEPELAAKVTIPFSQVASIPLPAVSPHKAAQDEVEAFKQAQQQRQAQAAHASAQTQQPPPPKPSEIPPLPENPLTAILQEYGFAIVTDVCGANALEQETLTSLFAQDLMSIVVKQHSSPEAVAKLAEDPIGNWPLAEGAWLGSQFCTDFGIPQGRMAWHIRSNPNVRTVFSRIFGEAEPDMCCGTDVVFFENRPNAAAPWEFEASGAAPRTDSEQLIDQVSKLRVPGTDESKAEADQKKKVESNSNDDDDANEQGKSEEQIESEIVYGETAWPHCDQNMQVLKADCPSGLWDVFQGVLYVTEAGPRTGTTVVWPGSHHLVTEKMMYEKNFMHAGHFVPLPREYHSAFVKHARRVVVPKGALLLWNSRTIHQGWGGPRLALPVCFEPKIRRSEEALTRKKKIVRSGGPSTHWASLGKAHDVGFRDKALSVSTQLGELMLVPRAHQFLFKNSVRGELPAEVEELL